MRPRLALPHDFASRPEHAQTLIERRVQAGFSQEELGDLIGASRTHVNLLEQGVHAPRHLAPRIAEALGGEPTDYLPETVTPSQSIRAAIAEIQTGLSELTATVGENHLQVLRVLRELAELVDDGQPAQPAQPRKSAKSRRST